MPATNNTPTFDPAHSQSAEFLSGVREAVAMANSGGGIVQMPVLEPGSPLCASDLTSAAVQGIINEYVGPGGIDIRRIARAPNASGQLMLFVYKAQPYPLIFCREGAPADGGPILFSAGDLFVRDSGRAVRADYEALVEHFNATARALFSPESATALLDVTVARRSRYSSALLDGMDLLWCLIERDRIDLTPPRADLLLRSSLRRTPTLFFWLSRISDRTLVEEVLLSSLEDEDRDSSDAKDSILAVAALVASDACVDAVLSRMRSSRFAHFQQAATEWQGRRYALQEFDRRVETAKAEDDPALDLPVAALFACAERLAGQVLSAGTPSPSLSRMLGDIGRVVYFKQSR